MWICGWCGWVAAATIRCFVVHKCTNNTTASNPSNQPSTISSIICIWFSFFVVLLLLFIPFQLLPFLFGYFRSYTIDKFLAKFQDVILIQTVLVVLFCFIIIIITSQYIVLHSIAQSIVSDHPTNPSTRVSIPSGGTTTECTYKL